MNRLITLLEDTSDKLFSKDMVLALSVDKVSDYDRGVIRGKIEMITFLLRELKTKDRDGKNSTI